MSVYKGEHKTPERVNQEYEAEIARLREREAQLEQLRHEAVSAHRALEVSFDKAEARVKELERELIATRIDRMTAQERIVELEEALRIVVADFDIVMGPAVDALAYEEGA